MPRRLPVKSIRMVPTKTLCELYKAPCPGYDRPLAFRFHGEPGHSLAREKPGHSSSRVPVSNQVLYNQHRVEGLPDGKARSRYSGVTTIVPHQPQPSFEDESLAFFLHEYCVYPSPGIIRGHLDFLEDMYRGSDRASCIRPATLATAYLSLSRHYKSSTLYVTARKYYGAALRSIRKDLSVSNKNTIKDETLASLMLLGIIEDIECQGQDMKAVHMSGIAKLFEIVGQKVLDNVSSSTLYSWIFVQMQVASLTTTSPMECLVISDKDLDISNPSLRLALVVTRIGQFYREARRITTYIDPTVTPAEQRVMLVTVIQQALALGKEVALISTQAMPSKLQPQQTTDKRPVASKNQPLISFNSQWTAATWTFFMSCLTVFFNRLHLCSMTLLALSSEGPDGPDAQLARAAAAIAEERLKVVAHMVCHTLPYLFGEVDEKGMPLPVPQRRSVIMYHIVWPLSVLIASPFTSPQLLEM
ncbi:Arginine metabolism regulation II [Fusarium heterosporum]|uniref:Arginine metabolism regulation II n=1 Tax=Fusarium heterosporum TaxID=42747 RepID=A0A8H5U1A1_FUSHE|nr:Arginine metabolism regulation II [Fusarium heterosporum]